jgi:hypothetical protein
MVEFGPLGCVLDESATLETDAAIAQATGESAFFGDNQSTASFVGRWAELKSKGVTGVFLWERYQKYRPLVPHWQKAGSCVGRGYHTASEMSYYNALATGVQVGDPVPLAWEPIYTGSRVYVGKGQLSGQGSVGSWAAQWLAGVNGVGGICRRDKYGSADLTLDNEPWAIKNSDRGDVMPPELLAECQKHTSAVHRVRNNSEIADSIASRYGVARCWNTLFGDRDSNGLAAPASQGAHCQAIIGVFVRRDGGDGFVEINSWGSQLPRGPRTLKYYGGEITLPPGCYGVTSENYLRAQRDRFWEAHCVAIRKGQEYR